MTAIPPNSFSQADLEEWYRLKEQLAKVKASEMLLRTKIFGFCFPLPVEGTNNYPLPGGGGYVLKGKYTINREVDPGAFDALRPKLVESKMNGDVLVQYKPSLVLKEYRTLTEEQRNLFDQCLIVKPGSPALEIVLPAKAKKAGEAA